MRIEGKTALITGGSSGLGAAAARMIADGGGRAVIADLHPRDGAGPKVVAIRKTARRMASWSMILTLAISPPTKRKPAYPRHGGENGLQIQFCDQETHIFPFQFLRTGLKVLLSNFFNYTTL